MLSSQNRFKFFSLLLSLSICTSSGFAVKDSDLLGWDGKSFPTGGVMPFVMPDDLESLSLVSKDLHKQARKQQTLAFRDVASFNQFSVHFLVREFPLLPLPTAIYCKDFYPPSPSIPLNNLFEDIQIFNGVNPAQIASFAHFLKGNAGKLKKARFSIQGLQQPGQIPNIPYDYSFLKELEEFTINAEAYGQTGDKLKRLTILGQQTQRVDLDQLAIPPGVTTLEFSGAQFPPDQLQGLFKRKLKSLTLQYNGNDFSCEHNEDLRKALEDNTTLQSLKFKDINHFTRPRLDPYFFEALMGSKITTFSFAADSGANANRNAYIFSEEEACVLSQFQHVDLSAGQTSKKGFEILLGSQTLKSLSVNIQNEKLGVATLEAAQKSTLADLSIDIYQDDIGDRRVKFLKGENVLNAFAQNSHLKNLAVTGYIPLSVDTIKALGANKTLRSLALSDTLIPRGYELLLKDLIQRGALKFKAPF